MSAGLQPTARAYGSPGRQPGIAPYLDNPAAVVAALREGLGEASLRLDDAPAPLSLVHADRLAGAFVDASGAVIAANAAFRRLFADVPPDAALIRRALTEDRAVTALSADAAADGARPIMLAAPQAFARDWALPEAVRAAAHTRDSGAVVLAVAAFSVEDALADAATAFGFTALEVRVAIALVRTGDVRRAAAHAGIAYDTARKCVANMLERSRTPRLTALIARLIRLVFGVWPGERDGDSLIGDVWGLTPRQAELALRIAQGMTRAEAARATGLSEAVAKKQLDIVYAALEVSSAAALARRVTEARALALLTDAAATAVLPRLDVVEPLRIFARPTGGEVAYSDYGPASGRPVLVLHSSTQSRHTPLVLVRALQAAGWRPIALDRPGFGFTDPPSDTAAWRADPFTAAARDVDLLCERLRLARIDIIARGGAQAALALMRALPHRVGRMVIVNPDPPTTAEGNRGGILGALRDSFYRFPGLIERTAWTLARRLDDARLRRTTLRVVAPSPPDVALMQNDEAFADYARGFRLFATGRVQGYVAEQTALVRWSPPPMPGLAGWRMLVSEHDPLHDPAHVRQWWRTMLPDTPMRTIPGTGRFLVMQRPDLIVEALSDAEPHQA